MVKTFNINDENFYNLLSVESYEYYKIIKDSLENGLVPCVKILRIGHKSSWYNNHIGKTYEIHKYIVDTNNGYINFLVKSNGDGSVKGYKPTFSSLTFGKGYDIVHNGACEIIMCIIGTPKPITHN